MNTILDTLKPETKKIISYYSSMPDKFDLAFQKDFINLTDKETHEVLFSSYEPNAGLIAQNLLRNEIIDFGKACGGCGQ